MKILLFECGEYHFEGILIFIYNGDRDRLKKKIGSLINNRRTRKHIIK